MLVKWGLCKMQMLIPQYKVLVLKLSPIYTVSLNTVFSIPQNQCYPGTPCTQKGDYYHSSTFVFLKKPLVQSTFLHLKFSLFEELWL